MEKEEEEEEAAHTSKSSKIAPIIKQIENLQKKIWRKSQNYKNVI